MYNFNWLYSIVFGTEIFKIALIGYLLMPAPQMPVMASTEDPSKEAIVMDCYIDLDGDGFGFGARYLSYLGYCPPGLVTNNDDCNPNDYQIHPGTTEHCTDRFDNNCDGTIDENCNIICVR